MNSLSSLDTKRSRYVTSEWAQHNNAIGWLEAGESQTAVARIFNVSQSTISRLWDRYQQNGSTRDLPGSGRQRVTTATQDRLIRLHHLRERFITATSTAWMIPEVHRISDETVRNRLQNAGVRARRPVTAVVLNHQHRQNRLQLAQTHNLWPVQWWRTVWFSDESRFLLQCANGRARVYRRQNERFAANCIQEADMFGGSSVMIWGAISDRGRTELLYDVSTVWWWNSVTSCCFHYAE
jgi:transposase